MIQFLNPALLWAILGVLIPVGIHLLSRKEGKVFMVGSIRFLAETSTSRFRSIHLNEVPLLILRCLLITLLVLIIAGMTFNPKHQEKWLLIEPGLEGHEQVSELRDSLIDAGYQARSFSSRFPLTADSTTDLNYWGMIEALRKKTLHDVVVLNRQYATNFKGERIALPPNIKWIHIPSEPPKHFITSQGVEGITDETATSFEHDIVTSTGQSPKNIKVAVFYDSLFSYDKDILIAVLKTIQEFSGVQFDIALNSAAQGGTADWHFYLGVNADKDKNVIRYEASDGLTSDLLVRNNACNDCFTITDRLTQDGVLKEKFTIQLARILLADRISPIDNYPDIRVMPDRMLWKSNATASFDEIIEPSNEEVPWLFLAFVTLLIVERYFSANRKQ